MDLSDDAKELMCGLFAFGHGTVRTSPPHAFRNKNKAAFDELESVGLVVCDEFNDYDVWVYSPTPSMALESEQHRRWYFSRHLPGLVT